MKQRKFWCILNVHFFFPKLKKKAFAQVIVWENAFVFF